MLNRITILKILFFTTEVLFGQKTDYKVQKKAYIHFLKMIQ